MGAAAAAGEGRAQPRIGIHREGRGGAGQQEGQRQQYPGVAGGQAQQGVEPGAHHSAHPQGVGADQIDAGGCLGARVAGRQRGERHDLQEGMRVSATVPVPIG